MTHNRKVISSTCLYFITWARCPKWMSKHSPKPICSIWFGKFGRRSTFSTITIHILIYWWIGLFIYLFIQRLVHLSIISIGYDSPIFNIYLPLPSYINVEDLRFARPRVCRGWLLELSFCLARRHAAPGTRLSSVSLFVCTDALQLSSGLFSENRLLLQSDASANFCQSWYLKIAHWS